MSFFNTTVHLTHRTPLPPVVTFDAAITLLRDHDSIIRLDPEFVKYTVDEPSTTASDPATKYYTVTDHMDALPAGLWDTTVSFAAEITDIEKGIQWVIRAPLGLKQTTFWTIEKTVERDEGFDLVEEVDITCSRLLSGTVKGKCESNWKGIHKRFAEKLSTPTSTTETME